MNTSFQPKIPSVPHLVHIETTYGCNQCCRFCYNPCRDMKVDLVTVDQIVEAVYDSWIPHVYLIGGEPSLLGVATLNRFVEILSRRSSVTIVTNGQIYLDDLSDKLACIGVPVHGKESTHDFLANKAGSFRLAMKSITGYVGQGFDVRCIPVLTSYNHDQMYEVIRLAKDMGMESVFVDRFEDGGMGAKLSTELMPSVVQFRVALEQMIAAREDFKLPVGWGTAIPFCLDNRLLACNMMCNCGAGITFAAINPKGDVRICNQSERVYGNVLAEPLSAIWHKPELDEFRDLRWISPACRSCAALTYCTGGCKVDVNCSTAYCVDYAVRGQEKPLDTIEIALEKEPVVEVPSHMRQFRSNRYARLNTVHAEAYLVTRYQTVELDESGVQILTQILGGVTREIDLIRRNEEQIESDEVRRFVSLLQLASAIDIVEEV